ncbi:MAG: DUF736 domain-containing protein [Pseudomonadota bacterium]
MPVIGTFEKLDDESYTGTLNTLTVEAAARIMPADDKRSDKSPDYRVYVRRAEIGAGWCRTAQESGRAYISISLAAPEFGAAPIYASLVQVDPPEGEADPAIPRGRQHQLIWNPQNGG